MLIASSSVRDRGFFIVDVTVVDDAAAMKRERKRIATVPTVDIAMGGGGGGGDFC
jgi:hypothetical protein